MKVNHEKKHTKKSTEQKPAKTPPDILLLDAVVRVVANKGVEGTSTRAVAAEAGGGITDTVIYRFFSGKEELMRQAFLRESKAFMNEVSGIFPVLWEKNISLEQRLRFLWHTVWTHLTHHKAACTFMIRYYYSASFDEGAMNGYTEIWQPLAGKLSDLVPGADTDTLVFMSLEIIAASVYPVCSGRKPDSASASEYGFRRLIGLVNEFLPR